MGNCKTILIVVIVSVLIGAYLFSENQDEKVRIYKEELNNLKVQNDTLLARNKRLDESIGLLKIKQDSVKELLTVKSKRIKQLKQINHEKIKAIEHYTNDKLFGFFANVNTDSTRAEW